MKIQASELMKKTVWKHGRQHQDSWNRPGFCGDSQRGLPRKHHCYMMISGITISREETFNERMQWLCHGLSLASTSKEKICFSTKKNELWFLFLLIWLDVRTASAKSSATLPPCKTFLTRAILLTWTSASFRELPRTLCFHKCDSFASAATRFASAKPCPVPSPLHVLQVFMSFRGKKLQKCFRELPRVGPEAHFSYLMSKSWLVLFKSKKTAAQMDSPMSDQVIEECLIIFRWRMTSRTSIQLWAWTTLLVAEEFSLSIFAIQSSTFSSLCPFKLITRTQSLQIHQHWQSQTLYIEGHWN